MYNNLIYYSDQPLLSSDFCNDLMDKFDRDPDTHSGYTTSNHKDHANIDELDKQLSLKIKQSTDLYLSPYPRYKKECNTMFRAISDVLDTYQEYMESIMHLRSFDFKGQRSRLTGFNLQRTSPGGFFNWHADDLIEGKWYRGMSYIIYLNDIHNDGYTEFYDGTRIQPKQGHIMMFPATWSFIHRGVPPVDETKYICVGWWQTNSHVHYTKFDD